MISNRIATISIITVLISSAIAATPISLRQINAQVEAQSTQSAGETSIPVETENKKMWTGSFSYSKTTKCMPKDCIQQAGQFQFNLEYSPMKNLLDLVLQDPEPYNLEQRYAVRAEGNGTGSISYKAIERGISNLKYIPHGPSKELEIERSEGICTTTKLFDMKLDLDGFFYIKSKKFVLNSMDKDSGTPRITRNGNCPNEPPTSDIPSEALSCLEHWTNKPVSIGTVILAEYSTNNSKCSFQINIPTVDPCSLTEKAPVKHYNRGPWNFDYQIVNGKGLVLKHVIAGTQNVFDSISVPHIKIEYGDGYKNSMILKFCDPTDPHPTLYFPKEIGYPVPEEDKYSRKLSWISWSYQKVVDDGQNNGLRGKLDITYKVAVIWGPSLDCEFGKNECYRFLPKLDYSFTPEPRDKKSGLSQLEQIPFKITAFYKIDYGPNTGLAITHDEDNIASSTLLNVGRQSILTTETKFTAVKNGQPVAKGFDNAHTVHPGQSIFLPGCRKSMFDCVHLHWRWSSSKHPAIDPLVNPLGVPGQPGYQIPETFRGKPFLITSNALNDQIPVKNELNMAVVNYNPSEDDPNDPLSLANDREIIATAFPDPKSPPPFTGGLTSVCYGCYLHTGGHPILWYAVSESDHFSNGEYIGGFFDNGFFVLNTDKPLFGSTGSGASSRQPHSNLP